ncbi:hypothetical protein C0Q70_09161 [Pomacea canaliculata]|uniref:Uncharacterized protein n=1 Tax=Pomacea canaliculata TaxID=400727 RepID=A0A2T7P910_POMCA|nr:hypothetical protein C0Q70_09161 [Pomacea canaliculata]
MSGTLCGRQDTSKTRERISSLTSDYATRGVRANRHQDTARDSPLKIFHIFNCDIDVYVDNLILLQFDTEFNETSSGLKPTDETQGSETDQEEIDPRPRTGSAGVGSHVTVVTGLATYPVVKYAAFNRSAS